MIRVVVFDFDGTLVDSNRIKDNCIRSTVEGIPGGLQMLAAARAKGGNRYDVFAEIARGLDPAGEVSAVAARGRALAAAYSACCVRGIKAAAERRGARAALAALQRRGFRVWINSATPDFHLFELLRHRGLERFLDGALGGPTSKLQNLRKILATEHCAPREALMVGDGPDDLGVACAAGTWFVAVTAEGRIPARGAFAMPHLGGLVPLIDRLSPRPKFLKMKRNH